MENKKWHTKVSWPLMVGIGFAVVCFLFFQLTYPYHFFFKGQNQLFLMSWPYVDTLFAKPAWAACLTGEFLTQFFYYKVAGAAILTATLTLLLWLTYWAVHRLWPNRWGALAVALTVALREASCHLYFGYVLSSTFALTGGLLMFLSLHRLIRRRWPWVLAVTVAGTIACYWLFGYGVWGFLLLSAVAVWRVAVPVAVVFASLLPLMRSHYNLNYADLCQYPGIGSLHAPAYDKETDFHIMHSYETGDWDDVVATAENDPLLNSLKNREVSLVTLSEAERVSASVRQFFYNLVQAQQGRLPDVLLNYYPNYLGTFTNMIEQKIPMLIFMNMHEFYYAISDISYTEKAAYISCITVPGNKNAYAIKRLAECALVTGEQEAVNKFMGLLRQTIPYREWAERAMSDKRYKEKAKFMNLQDSISPNANSHLIMTQLLRSNPNNHVALDYMLCSLLQVKEIENFKRDFDLYFPLEERRIPRLYQEALCIWLVNHQATEEEWEWYVQDDEVLDRLEVYADNNSDPRLSDTYWHYFDTFNFEAY